MGPMIRWMPLLLALAGCGSSALEDLVDADLDGFFVNDPDPTRADCDDRPTIGEQTQPGAEEICDGRDNDCNGKVDDDALGALEWWPDEDADGFGRRVPEPTFACRQPEGFSANRKDCNDADASVFPQALERCNQLDDDCDLTVDEGFDPEAEWFLDADRDGFGGPERMGEGCATHPDWVRDGTDCNDVNKYMNPAATEVCNGYDDDCDGLVDGDDLDDLEELVGARTWYADQDGDGYGSVIQTLRSCIDQPPSAGWVLNSLDCNDEDERQNPDSVWFLDDDRDGFGIPDATWPTPQCWQPIGFSLDVGDCDDASAEDWSTRLWFADADRDGWGFGVSAADAVWQGCRPDDVPSDAWAPTLGDCDDRDPGRSPDAVEVCDTNGPGGSDLDDDCDGLAGDADDLVFGTTTWYFDHDADGFGTTFGSVESCVLPQGYAPVGGDCDDNDASRSPNALWFRDADRDGFGDPATAVPPQSCEVVPGHVSNDQDCDDSDYAQNLLARWWPDADGDGLGTGTVPAAIGCNNDTTGFASWTGDCDDTDPADDAGGCYGPQVGTLELVIDVDKDIFSTDVFVACSEDGGEPVHLTPEVQLDDTDFDREVTQSYGPLAAGQTCTVTVVSAFDTDTAGDGPLTVAFSSCGTDLGTVSSSVANTGAQATDTSAPFTVASCSGCTDPAAENYQPGVIVPNDAESCIYAP